jgi:hypothetical protein
MTAAKKVQPRCSTSTSHVQLAYAEKVAERGESKRREAWFADKRPFDGQPTMMDGYGVQL